MNENDAIRRLADANPVRPEDLNDLQAPASASRRSKHRLGPIVAVAGMTAATIAAVVAFGVGGSSSQAPYSGADGPPAPPPPVRIPLSAASAALGGAPVILPAQLTRADIGSVTKQGGGTCRPTDCVVTVTFRSRRGEINYGHFAPDIDPLLDYEVTLAEDTVPVQLVYLGSVPAVLYPKGHESLGGGSTIRFQVGETTITVFSRHYGDATVEGLARSIVDQYRGTALPEWQAPLADTAPILGAHVVLPSSSLVGSPDAALEVSPACPSTGCEVTVAFPSASLTVRYLRAGGGLYRAREAIKTFRAVVRKSRLGARVVELDGRPALFVPEAPGRPGWIQFVTGRNLNVFVQGQHDEATLKAVARSIIRRSSVRPPQGSAGIGHLDWSLPLGGTRVSSVAEAAASLSFRPVVPAGLGSAAIFIDRPGELSFVYRGRYRLVESPARGTTTAVLRKIAKECWPWNDDCEWRAMVPLDGGNKGLLLQGSASTGLFWVDKGIYFDVMGPPASFAPKQAISVANRAIAAAG